MILKILKLFVNTLTVDDKYSLPNRDNLEPPIQMQLSQKQKTFSEVFLCLFKIYMELFQKKMTLIRDVFLILRIPKMVLR